MRNRDPIAFFYHAFGLRLAAAGPIAGQYMMRWLPAAGACLAACWPACCRSEFAGHMAHMAHMARPAAGRLPLAVRRLAACRVE